MPIFAGDVCGSMGTTPCRDGDVGTDRDDGDKFSGIGSEEKEV